MPTPIDPNARVNNGGGVSREGELLLVKTANFADEVLKAQGPVAVEFMNFSCIHCIRAQPMLKDVAKGLAGKVKVVQVEVGQSPELFDRYGIQGTPTFVMFKDGKEVDRGGLPAINSFEIRKLITGAF